MTALLLDATAALAPDADERVLEITGVLARLSPPRGLVRSTRGALTMVDPAVLTSGTPLSAVRRWLLGGARPAPPRPMGPLLPAWPRRPPAVPGTVLLKPGVVGWDDPALRAWLARHPGVRPLALVDKPVGFDWPEYSNDASLAALRAGLAALSRLALAVVVPDAATRTWMQGVLAEAGRGSVAVHVVEPPSVLAKTTAMPADPPLAAVPYLVAPGGIEDRANTLLLLQIWRDLIRSGVRVPKLVLAGRRGRQIEEIRPLLDWNEAVAAAVVEAPGLEPDALRHLVVHARALLAPAFAGSPAALLRDARALGTPVIAAADGAAARSESRELDPTDGPAWREAILAAARREVFQPPAVVLPSAGNYLGRVADLLG